MKKFLLKQLPALVLVVTWGVVAWSYYGPQQALQPAEIDAYIERLANVLGANATPPEGEGLAEGGLTRPLQEMRAFAERDDGRPVYMVNLMKWRRGDMVFPPGKDATGIATPLDADLAYNSGLFWTLAANASHTAFLAGAEPNAFNYGTASEADGWGEIGIFRYRSRRDFFEMVTSKEYDNILYLKLLSMGEIALVPTQVHGLLFNPMPNIPVSLGALFVLLYLSWLLLYARLKG